MEKDKEKKSDKDFLSGVCEARTSTYRMICTKATSSKEMRQVLYKWKFKMWQVMLCFPGNLLPLRKMKLASITNRKQSDSRLSKTLKAKFGEDSILVMGNWGHKAHRVTWTNSWQRHVPNVEERRIASLLDWRVQNFINLSHLQRWSIRNLF